MGAGDEPSGTTVKVAVDLGVISIEALLKTCHWMSPDFVCEITGRTESSANVLLTPRNSGGISAPQLIRDIFLTNAMDFALRERVEAKTSGIRDLLLAKAFSESGVLEDQPEGVFGDPIEEAKPDGMFKILGNSTH